MQVFIIGSVIETAKCLDKRRLNKQIVECHQILDAIRGKKDGWKNHPCVLQYKNDISWLEEYTRCLEYYKAGELMYANDCDFEAWVLTPTWHTKEYYNNMKMRLYTKDNDHYSSFKDLGESYTNMYWDIKNKKWKYYDVTQK